MKKLARFIATFGGWGASPKMPGTAGSLGSLIFALLFFKKKETLKLSFILSTIIGLWSSHQAGGGKDYKWIVIDETAGMWLSLLGCWPQKLTQKKSFLSLLPKALIAFALFRLFDITKPGPIGKLDERHDATGIMGDDILAGFFTCLIMALAKKWRHKR